ncbi:MAG TPA: hypothetical protein VF950_07000 [Planctomycetota bacterium]
MKAIVLLALSVPLLASPRAAALPAWVSALPLWEWHAIPNTALSSVEPTPRPLGITGPASKIVAWCGATLKRQGSVYLIGAAGGHADYGGNEVDALQLNSETPGWVQLRGPSANADMVGGAGVYLDGRGASTHTYYATQFIDARNRLIVFENPGASGGPFPAPPADYAYAKPISTSFNLGTNDWDPPSYIPSYTAGGDWTACLVVKHPVTEDVYYNRYAAGWWRWTQATNTWVKLSDHNQPGNYRGAAIDPTRNRMLLVGGNGAPSVRELDGAPIPTTFGGLGAAALTVGGYPAVIYDEVNDAYLAVFNEGTSIRVLRIHAGTWAVDAPALTGTPPAARQNGIQNAAQYVPELGGLVLANTYGGNVYFLRTSAAGGAVPAPAPAPAAPAAPSGGSSGGDDSRCSCGTIQGGGGGALAAAFALLLGIRRRKSC